MNNLISRTLLFLGIKKEATLAEIDNLEMSKIDDISNIDFPNIDNMPTSKETCDFDAGVLYIVKPEIWMEGMILCECETCHERVYRIPIKGE